MKGTYFHGVYLSKAIATVTAGFTWPPAGKANVNAKNKAIKGAF